MDSIPGSCPISGPDPVQYEYTIRVFLKQKGEDGLKVELLCYDQKKRKNFLTSNGGHPNYGNHKT